VRQTIISVVAIICVAALTTYALTQGQDGALLATAFTIIGGLAGYEVAKQTKRIK